MVYSIHSNELEIEIDSYGAELVSIKHNGKEKIWQNENGQWSGHAPVLFPVCGRCAYVTNGKKYKVGFHGFAKRSEFTIKSKSKSSITFVIGENFDKKIFPYDFEFSITYKITGDKLNIYHEVTNLGGVPFYFSSGSHESYNFDKEIGHYTLNFNKNEKFISLCHNIKGRLTGKIKDFGSGKSLLINEKALTDSKTIILSNVKSDTVDVTDNETGEKVLTLYIKDYPNLLLWRPSNEKMVCIEPWHSLPDNVLEKGKDVSQKDGFILINPQQKIKLYHGVKYYS